MQVRQGIYREDYWPGFLRPELNSIVMMACKDNEGARRLAETPPRLVRSKRMDMRRHSLCDDVQEGRIDFRQVLEREKHANLRWETLGMQPFTRHCHGLLNTQM